MDEDTDTLLALIESSLKSNVSVTQEEMLEALVNSGGNVDRATRWLSNTKKLSKEEAGSAVRPFKRQKLNHSLDGWLEKSASSSISEPSSVIESSTRKSSEAKLHLSLNPPPLLSILRAPSSSSKKPDLPPLLLGTPELVAKNTPTTLHYSILPNDLACRLYYVMLEEAKRWKPNKWYINDRLVESPHLSGFYARDPNNSMHEAAKYWYNGQATQMPKSFPDAMEEALLYIEDLVNEHISMRKRYPLEWAGSPKDWRANVAASNCYRGSKEGVGAHADRLTYLGPYPTIASLSLGTTRKFRLREVIPFEDKDERRAQTFDIPLPHNSLLIMHPPTQEYFKHSIPAVRSIDTFRPSYPRTPGEDIYPHNERINITFRFYRPDFQPASIPRCYCEGDIPTTLKSNQRRRGYGEDASFFWQCQAGAQNEGKSCYYWKEMNMEAEGRGPCIRDVPT